MKFVFFCFLASFYSTLQQFLLPFTNDNFETELNLLYEKKYDFLLIYFYNDWSSDSKIQISNQYVKVYNGLGNIHYRIRTAICNQKQNKLINYFNLTTVTLPKFILYSLSTNSSSIYSGQFKPNEVVGWVGDQIIHLLKQSLYPEIQSFEELDNLVDEKEAIVTFINAEENIITQVKEKLPSYFKDNILYQIKNESLLEKMNLTNNKNETNVLIFKSYDEYINNLKSKNVEDILSYIQQYYYQIIYNFTNEVYLFALNNKLNFSLLFLNNNDSDQEIINELSNQIKLKARGKGFFILIDKEEQETTFHTYSQYKQNIPFGITFIHKNKKYLKFKESLNNTKAFIDKWINGCKGMERLYKSQSEFKNENYEKEKVYKLVGRNFNKVIYEEKKEYYSLVFLTKTNCELCQEYGKVFKKFALTYNQTNNIFFGMIDIFENEIENVDIISYPSFILIDPKTHKYQQMEDSIITEESFQNFVSHYTQPQTTREEKEEKKESVVKTKEEVEVNSDL